MSTNRLKRKPDFAEHVLKSEHLAFSCAIVHNATPASKTFSCDIPSVVMLRAQGLTAAVDAVETLTWTAAADNTAGASVFGIYLNIGASVTPSLGAVASTQDFADKVYSVVVTDTAGKTLAVTGPNNVANSFITPLGNIAIEIASSNLNLATTDDTFNIVINYREAKA